MRSIKLFSDKVLLYLVSILLLGIIVLEVKEKIFDKKISYVDISQLVENYKLKKDLEGLATNNLYAIKNVIDSLSAVKKINPSDSGQLSHQIENAQQAFQQYYTQSNQEITKKIWERLNPIINDFGKEKGYQIIIGATGTGALLYADKSHDVTEELTKYVNDKYEKAK